LLARAAINNAQGLALGANGVLYIADTLNGMVRGVYFDKVGEEVVTVAGGDPGYRNGSRALARFLGPVGVVTAPDGTLYVADGNAIRAIAP
jgi:hypothetical protein